MENTDEYYLFAILNFLVSTVASAGFAVVLLAVVGWLARSLISNRLRSSVEHEFNEKLAALQAQLDAQRDEASALREGLLGIASRRESRLADKELDALECLWEQAVWLRNVQSTVQSFEQVINCAVKDLGFSDFDEVATNRLNEEGYSADGVNAVLTKMEAHRPYLHVEAWALFHCLYLCAVHEVTRRNERIKVPGYNLGAFDFSTSTIVASMKRYVPGLTDVLGEDNDMKAATAWLVEKVLGMLRGRVVGEHGVASDSAVAQRLATAAQLTKDNLLLREVAAAASALHR